MKHKLSEWMSKARRLDSAIGARVDGAARQLGGAPVRQPLEVVHDVVRAVEHEVQPAGRGRHVFPFTHVRVWLTAPSPMDRARLEAACEGPPALDTRIRERLAAAGCEADQPDIRLTYVAKGRAEWREPDYHVEFSREATQAAPEPSRVRRLDLAVTHGTAEHERYTFTTGVLTLGRARDVRDTRERLLRTNDVAFADDGSDVNLSVSRRHAHITPDPSSGFRLHDDGSGETRVMRDGRGVPVPRGRGLRLRHGDEIVLGQARIRVSLADEETSGD